MVSTPAKVASAESKALMATIAPPIWSTISAAKLLPHHQQRNSKKFATKPERVQLYHVEIIGWKKEAANCDRMDQTGGATESFAEISMALDFRCATSAQTKSWVRW